jgi:cyclic 2,3-diphosphoglycerate synthetase
MRAVVLADGNFGAAAVRRAIDFLTVDRGYSIVAAAVVGAVSDDFTLGVPVVFGADVRSMLDRVAAEYRPQIFVDVTEADLTRKLERAIIAARLGIEMRGADYVISPPPVRRPTDTATLSIVGTGEVGKTAVALSLIEAASGICKPGHASMQLGLPPYPEVVSDVPLSAESILSAYVAGRAVGGDHYTVATAAGVPTCGCSFAGTGLSGVPVSSVVADGVLLLADVGAELVFVEGSGSSISPVEPDGWVAVVTRATRTDELYEYADAYSLSSADMVIVTAPKHDNRRRTSLKKLTSAIRLINPDVPVETGRIVPYVLGNVKGSDVCFITDGTAEEAGERAGLIGGKSGANVVKSLGSEAVSGKKVSFGTDKVLLELGISNFGDWLKKCAETGADVVFVAERFVPAKKKSFKVNAAALIEKALAARDARR